MEDEVRTIIYILLTAVALIIAALGRKKKKGTQGPDKPAEEKSTTDPFSLFEYDNEQPESEFEEVEAETVEATPPLTNVLGMTIEEGVTAFKEGAVQTEHEEERLKIEMETDNSEHQPEEDLMESYGHQKKEASEIDNLIEEFDLKKAVIYSEIINRKKF